MFQDYFAVHSLHKVLSRTALYHKACTKLVPVLLCSTKLAQSTSQYYFACTTKLTQSTFQYYFALQSLHKAPSRTTLYCATRLAQSTSQYYFALQSLRKSSFGYYFVLQHLHKALPSTTLHYNACTKHIPVLLCVTELAQSTSQYNFVL